jgi:hypothetical protein
MTQILEEVRYQVGDLCLERVVEPGLMYVYMQVPEAIQFLCARRIIRTREDVMGLAYYPVSGDYADMQDVIRVGVAMQICEMLRRPELG